MTGQPDESKEQSLALAAAGVLRQSQPLSASSEVADGDDEDEQLESGTVINSRYLVVNRIGKGAMGSVYRVVDTLTQATLALKIISSAFAKQKKLVKRLQHEVQAAQALTHPNIIKVFDMGVIPDGSPFFVMECVEGTNLQNVLQTNSQLDATRAIPIFIQIAEALEHAHSRGVIHRDLKPANILLAQSESGGDCVKLVDFGIAKVIDDQGPAQTKLTQTGEILGSPSYMSPEQCRGYPADARSDIYAFGCIMYESLSGQCPFDGENCMAVLLKHIFEEAKPLIREGDEGKQLALLVMRCLEKNPEDRYQTAEALLLDLRAIQDGNTIASVSRKNAKRTKIGAGVLGICAATLIASTTSGAYLLGNGTLHSPISKDTSAAEATWQYFDQRGQELANHGHFQKAAAMFTQARAASNCSERQSRILLKKLAMTYHILKDASAERRMESQIECPPAQECDELTTRKRSLGMTNSIIEQIPEAGAGGFADGDTRSSTQPPMVSSTSLVTALRLIPTKSAGSQKEYISSIGSDVLKTGQKSLDSGFRVNAVTRFLGNALPDLYRLLGADSLVCNQLNDIYSRYLVLSHQYKKAIKPAEDAIVFFSKNPSVHAEELNSCLVRLARIRNLEQQPAAAATLSKEVMDNLSSPSAPKSTKGILVDAQLTYAAALLAQKHLDEACLAYLEALEQAKLEQNSEQTDEALRALCVIYEYKNDFQSAERLLVSYIKDAELTGSPSMAAAYEQAIGELYYGQNEPAIWTQSHSHFEKALSIRQKLLAPESQEVQRSLLSVINYDIRANSYKSADHSSQALARQLLAIVERQDADPKAIQIARAALTRITGQSR